MCGWWVRAICPPSRCSTATGEVIIGGARSRASLAVARSGDVACVCELPASEPAGNKPGATSHLFGPARLATCVGDIGGSPLDCLLDLVEGGHHAPDGPIIVSPTSGRGVPPSPLPEGHGRSPLLWMQECLRESPVEKRDSTYVDNRIRRLLAMRRGIRDGVAQAIVPVDDRDCGRSARS